MIPCIILAIGAVALNVSVLAYIAADTWRFRAATLASAELAQVVSIAAAYLGVGLLLALVVICGLQTWLAHWQIGG